MMGIYEIGWALIGFALIVFLLIIWDLIDIKRGKDKCQE